ncbi:MAG: Tex family protein [Saprospiraceae bacterium]
MNKLHLSIICDRLSLPARKVESTVELLATGATVPFLARYRKEATGSLDEVQINDIKKEVQKLAELEKRKEFIHGSITEQGKMTEALEQRIQKCYDLTALEDIYLPYKKKRKTKASVAKEKGLEPLANLIFKQADQHIHSKVADFLNEEVADAAAALQGARDIIAEWVSEDEEARNKVRYSFKRDAIIRSKVARGKDEVAAKYKDYFAYEETLKNCPSHRLLAIRRGEEEGFLRVSIQPDEEDTLYQLDRLFLDGNGEATREVKTAVHDSYKRLIAPSIETEFRNLAKEKADEEAIAVFADNLRQLLLAAPLGQRNILALDPGFRTGCKLVCLDAQGNLLHHSAIYPHPPQQEETKSIAAIKKLVVHYDIDAIAIGNGTAGRETMSLLKPVTFDRKVTLYLVNENGASIYSASEIAREEFPDKDITVRGAVSIGRRLMDPLAELVKIDAKSIGVGQYQHDVNQNQLKSSLDTVVESCVNAVGINLNTASKHLLNYVSGLGPTLAQNIVAFRKENGGFKERKQLKKVARMGDKAFEQAAGFLRIRDGKNPLDNTGVHPESYPIVTQMAKRLSCSILDLIQNPLLRKQIRLEDYVTETVGMPTLLDIMKELEKPGLDPRGEAKTFEFAQGIHKIGDVNEGMILPGIITNITNFGAFVDIGIKQDGLVHISQIANKFVKNPADVVQLQQQVQVKVIGIDIDRGRVNLSMKEV